MRACSYKHRLVPLSVDSDEEDEEEESLSSREVVTVFPFLSLVNHNKIIIIFFFTSGVCVCLKCLNALKNKTKTTTATCTTRHLPTRLWFRLWFGFEAYCCTTVASIQSVNLRCQFCEYLEVRGRGFHIILPQSLHQVSAIFASPVTWLCPSAHFVQ